MRPAIFLVLASILFASSASAADVTPLQAGKPAGVRKAQMDSDITPIIFFGAVAVGIGIALAVAHNDNKSPASAGSTTTTS